MEPRIEYATTADGVSIGHCTIGQGHAFVVAPGEPISQILLTWRVPAWLGFCQRLAGNRRLVLYDGRGTGVSGKEEIEYSLETQVIDLSGVVDHLRLDTFVLFAPLSSGPAAITYTVSNPDRVSQLILWCTYANSAEYFGSPAWQALQDLMNNNWELFLQTLTHARFGSEGHESTGLATLIRSCITLPLMQAFLDGVRGVDVTGFLAEIKAPTMVLHRRELHVGPSIDNARNLASRIPDARLVVLEGNSVAPYQGNVEAVLSTIGEFLGDTKTFPRSSVATKLASEELAEPLSERELQVLNLIAAGLSNREIANELVIATGTVKTHINNIYSKLEVRSRTRALAKARELDLV